MVKVNTQIPEDIHDKIMKISKKRDWTKMKILGKLVMLAFKHGLDKEL